MAPGPSYMPPGGMGLPPPPGTAGSNFGAGLPNYMPPVGGSAYPGF